MPGHMSLMLSGALSGIRNIRHDYNLANGNGAAGNAGLKERLEDLQTKSELKMSHQQLKFNCPNQSKFISNFVSLTHSSP